MALTIPGTEQEDEEEFPKINIETAVQNSGVDIKVTAPEDPIVVDKYLSYAQDIQRDQMLQASIPTEVDTPMPDYATYGQNLQKANAESLKNSLKIASLADKDQAAAIKELSEQTGLNPSFIAANVNEVKRMVELTALDVNKLAVDNPILAKQLQDPLFAAMAYDDIDKLSGIEAAATATVNTFRSVFSGLPSASGGAYQALGVVPGSIDAILDFAGIDTEYDTSPDRFIFKNLLNVPQAMSEGFQSLAKGQFDLADEIQGDLSRYPEWMQSALQGPKSMGMMAPGMLGFFMTGNPAFIYGTAGVASGGYAMQEGLDQGLSYSSSVVYGITQGTTEAAFEMLPALRFMRDLKVGSSLFKTIGAQMLIEIPQEQLTTITQDLNDFVILPSDADLTFGDYLKERPNSAWHTLIATITGVGTQTTTMYGVNKALNKYLDSGIQIDPEMKRMIEDEMRATEALEVNERMTTLVQKLQESKMMDLSPDSLKGFVRELFQSENETDSPKVVIYAQDLVQYAEEQGIDLNTISPLISDQVEDTVATQGYFEFNVEDYLTDIAVGQHGEGINQLLRVNENAMSVAEASKWNEGRNERLIEQADAIISSMANEEKQPGEQVYNDVVEQLVKIGTPRDQANQSAILYKAFFTVMGDRAGIDAKQLYDRYGLQLQRNLPSGAVTSSDTDTLSDLAGQILDTEISSKATARSQTKEAKVLLDKVNELKTAKQEAKDAASDFVEGDGTTKPTEEEINAYYAENVEPAEVAQLEAEIEYERLLQSRNMSSESSIASVQRVINEKLERIAKIQGIDFVEEAAPGVVESTETTVEQIEEIRAYLESEMGVDLQSTTKQELIDLIRNNFYDPQGRTLEQAAFHGTPFQGVIEQFSTDFIGTGEGAVAYGWGLYFASKEAVARHYMEGDILEGDLYVDGELIKQGHKDFDLFDYVEWQPGDSIDTLIDAIYEEKAQHEENLRYDEEVLEKLSAGEEVENWIWVGMNEENTSLMLKTPQQKPWQGARLASFADSPINDDPFITDQELNNRNQTTLIGGLPSANVYLVQYQRPFDRWVVQARGDTKNDALDAYEARAIEDTREQIATREVDLQRTKEYADAFIDVRTDLGKIYKVDLKPAEEDYLIWDNELNDQSDKVKKVINKLIKKYKLGTAGGLNFGRDVYKHISYVDEIYANFETKTRWPEKEIASKFLLSEGIRGVKFADGATRNRDDIIEKDYNYVIFDGADVEITKTFNQSAVEPQGLREGEVMHFHSSPNIFDQFEINENRLGGTYPSGIYHHGTKARTTGYGDNTYRIAVELGKVGTYFPHTPKDINQAMEDKYFEILMGNTGDRGPSHENWVRTQARKFRESGSMQGRFTGLEKREVWIAGGYDTIKDGQDFISFHPEAVRILEVNGKPAPPMREFFQSANEPTLEAFVAQKQGVPVPESELLTTLYGRVENELQSLLDKVKGNAELLTTRRLSSIFGSPKKRKNKDKLDKNVKPIGYKDLKMMLDWAIANDSPGNWYKEFGEGFASIVGRANLQEASILFGITSAQNAAETNFSDTLHLMALARQFDPITQEKQFRNAVRNTPRPGGQRLKITGRQIDAVVDMYQTGTYKGGLKVSTYMQLIRARGLNEFNPFSVQDVHMSRVFGYRYKDIDKDTGNVVDAAKFPSSQAIRYAMWMTNKLADEYGMKPDAVQANLWFYAKKNLTPKKTSGKKTVVGDGTYESAANYAAPEIEAIQSLVDAGTFDKNNALTTALETGERPSFESDVISDPFTNADFNNELLALAEARAPRILVSSNPGNARGYGFPEGTTLEQLRDYNQEVLAAITDENGQIKLLREMGIVHKVGDTFGTFERVEPTFEITFPGETFETAQFASKLLGEAMMQDGTITEKTSFGGQQFGIRVQKADGSQFSTEDLTKIYQQVNPEQSMDGLNFTRTGDGTGLKFLDGKYFEDSSKYSNKQLKEFQTQISEYFSNEGYNLDLIAQESEYYDHTERSRSNRERTWNRSGIEGRSDLQRSAISSLYQPIHEVYGNWQRRLDFKPQNETSALAELLEVSESQLQAELQSETYNQQQRGSIQFRSGETIISLFEGADRSTFLHESGHLFLEIMQDLGEDPNAPDAIKKDWQTTLDYLGVKSGDEIGVEQHEKWAESFEKYLFEGKAPSNELREVFHRFKRWLKSVYQQMQNLNVEINDDIRGVFDRMLSTSTEIAQAERTSRLIPMFESIENSNMTQAEWNNYQDTSNASTRQAEDALDFEKIKQLQREDKKWYKEAFDKAKTQVEAEVNEMAVYQVIHFLQTGDVLTGELLPDVQPMKLDKKALIDEFGQILGQLPKGRKIHTTKDGVHHDLVAEIFGFESGIDMVEKIMEAKPRKQLIEEVARQRLMKATSDMQVDRAKLEEEAIKAAHMADQRSRLLHLELKSLEKSANMEDTPAAAARNIAIERISRMKVQDIHVNRFRASEVAAGRAAFKALAEQKYEEAANQKRIQLLNHHLYREAEKKKARVATIVRYFTRLNKPATRQRLAREYIEPIYELFEHIEFRAVSKKEREQRYNYAALVERETEAGNEVVLTDEIKTLLSKAGQVNYKDLTFGELENVYEAVKNIETIARLEQKALDEESKLNFLETVDEMVTAADEIEKRNKDVPDFTEGKLKTIKEGWNEFHAAHDKIEYVLESMDNFQTNGIWWRNMFKPLADAGDREMEMNEQFIDRMKTIMLDRYTRKERNAWNKKLKTRVGTFNKKNILAMALNWGNEENRTALKEGFKNKKDFEITDADIEQMLDDHMEQRDWDMVQDIWIMIDELWPEVAALQKELTGLVPEKVVPTPFETKFGTMRGGYYPLKFDHKFDTKQRKDADKQAAEELFENISTRAATRKGHTKERKGSGGRFVRLDLDVLSEHMHDVIHDITHRKAILYVNRLSKQPEIQRSIKEVLGSEVNAQITPWLKSIAAPEPNYHGTLERMANWTRHSATIVAMGFKVTTAMVQPMGYSQSAAYLGEEWSGKGLSTFYKNPTTNRQLILKKSVYMRNRSKTLDRDVRDSVRRIANGDSKMKDMQSKYFYFIGLMDMTVSLPTWQAAYMKSIWEGMSEKDAIAQGDSAVRMTQGSGEMKDMANIQKGTPVFKLFTQFYSYFSAYYGASKRTVQMRMRNEISTWQAFKQFAWLTILPAVLTELMLGRGPDEEDDENFYLWGAKKIVEFPFMGMVGVRDFVSAIFNPQFGTALPYTDVLDSIIAFGGAWGDLMSDDEFNNTDIKNIIVGLGYILKLPSRQIANMEEHLYEVFAENEDFSLFELLVKVDRDD
jgi:hypothetical protein